MIRVFYFRACTASVALFLLMALSSVSMGQGNSTMPQRRALPPEIAASAQKAVQQLMAEVVKGNLKPTVDLMHPLWKKKAAKRLGGESRLAEEMGKALAELRAKGITILSSKALVPRSGFEVWEEAEKQMVNGREVETGQMHFRDWLVFVPTVTRYRVVNPETKRVVVIEKTGFILAIMTKGKPGWTFIDGATITAKQMRTLFPNLPAEEAELRLPKKGGRVIE